MSESRRNAIIYVTAAGLLFGLPVGAGSLHSSWAYLIGFSFCWWCLGMMLDLERKYLKALPGDHFAAKVNWQRYGRYRYMSDHQLSYLADEFSRLRQEIAALKSQPTPPPFTIRDVEWMLTSR